MKRILSMLFVLILLCGVASADSRWTCTNCYQSNTGNFCSNCANPRPVENNFDGIYLTSNARLATRTGPGTNYAQPGSFYSAGVTYKVISKSGIWFQVELTYLGMTVRVYTGAKRFDYTAAQYDMIPEEYVIYRGTMRSNSTVYSGPSTTYEPTHATSLDYTKTVNVYAGTEVAIYAIENGYAQIDFYMSNGVKCRGWVPESRVSY